MEFDLVVAHYRESFAWLEKYIPISNIYLYTKSSGHFTSGNKRFNWEMIPNIGREATTYLHHIIKHYNELDKPIIFCQGDPYNHLPDFDEWVQKALKEEDRFLKEFYWFGHESNIQATTRFANTNLDPFEILPVGELYCDLFDNWGYPDYGILYHPWSMFMVTPKRIRQRPLKFYKQMFALLTIKYCASEQSSFEITPYYGRGAWAVERLWGKVFNSLL